MPILLHILTEPADTLTDDLIARHKANSENQVEIVDLTRAEADYKQLLETIFKADSVQVW